LTRDPFGFSIFVIRIVFRYTKNTQGTRGVGLKVKIGSQINCGADGIPGAR
jgi:hypothetical protein